MTSWNGTLDSKLIDSIITSLSSNDSSAADIFKKATSSYNIDTDKVGSFVADSIKRGVALPTVSSALATMLLTRALPRATVSRLGSPSENPMVESWQVADDACHAFHGSMIVTIVQALQAINAASGECGWNVKLTDCLSTWRGGSLVSSNLLDPLIVALGRTSESPTVDVLEEPSLASELTRRQLGWRRIVTLGIASGVSTSTLASSLMYYDSHHAITAYKLGQMYQ